MSHHDIKLYNPLVLIRRRASVMPLNIYYLRCNIFYKDTFKRLFKKKGMLSEKRENQDLGPQWDPSESLEKPENWNPEP